MIRFVNSLAIAGLVLFSPMAAQANSTALADQIRFYEYSVMRSSVSPTLSDEAKSEKMQLLEDARYQVALGNNRTAQGLLKRVAQDLYRMTPVASGQPVARMGVDEAEAILSAIESILPQAHKIALEKQVDQEPLVRVMRDYQVARVALDANDMATVSNVLDDAYRALKQHVAGLRSGDLLMIKLPDPGSREGWMDAAHRYLDWRYFNSELLTAMQDSGLDTSDIDKANREADQVYDLASTIALQGDWQQAVATVDRAYRILEKAWRNVGVDVGI